MVSLCGVVSTDQGVIVFTFQETDRVLNLDKSHLPKVVALFLWVKRLAEFSPSASHMIKKNPYFSTKTYAVGTQKNHLNEVVLLSTQNTC